MATSRFILLPTDAQLPSSNPAVLSAVQTSSAVATANTPKPTTKRLEFDQTTDQAACWNIPCLDDYLSTLTVILRWGAAVNTNAVKWKAGVSVIKDATDITALTYLAADTPGAIAVPATVGLTKATSWALTATSLAAGDALSLFIGRDADDGGDTAAGTAHLWDAALTWTS